MSKAKQPKAYVSTSDVYTAGIYTKAGEPFVTDAPKGEGWDEKTPEEVHAIEGSLNKIPGDPPITEKLGLDTLRAIAVVKNINVDGLSAKQLVDAIKAANEPTL